MDIMLWLTGIVQWLHIVAAIIWLGGTIFMYYGVYPTLLKLTAQEGQKFLGILQKYAGPLMAISGSAVVVLGLIRGTVFGPIRSWAVLGSPYGLTFIAAFVLAIVLTIMGAQHEKIVGPVWEGDKVKAGFASRLKTTRTIEMLVAAVVLVCMVLMKFGY